ncbi:polysaccharide biosynthesis/export family protein [Alterisphingorhabdus coralli]|uniref:Polysaccharide biosynthesis/export family protein n=1 Tax=Alterisphingorhabdus coralli TaxID=3071408 RepID=A0AA97I1J5_9SPHN|nr:polysaccharide biosynthesis/export family protein [Parasphingorhabdus sp. SCSIO 66989]WOE74810.1 polysaccharide biosynthesis/export family protein [Parasphingorhabdus sp. SCSIO 66989]
MMILFKKFFIVFIVLITLSACAADRSTGLAPEIQVTELTELPPPRGESFYTIGAEEKLEISVVGDELLSGTYLTDEFGGLNYPFLGKLELEGLTPNQASQIISDGLRGRYLLEPQVRIIPEEFPQPTFSIGGQVRRPGNYPAFGRQTLLRAVNSAQGVEEYAKLEDVLILRTVNGQNYIGLYNLAAIQRGNYSDPDVYPNDIVIVGDSPERRNLDRILQAVPQLITSFVIFITRN